MVYSRPCIGDLKGWKTLFTCHFYSEVSASLRAALCGFLGGHERLSLGLCTRWFVFFVDVVSFLNIMFQKFVVVNPTT